MTKPAPIMSTNAGLLPNRDEFHKALDFEFRNQGHDRPRAAWQALSLSAAHSRYVSLNALFSTGQGLYGSEGSVSK